MRRWSLIVTLALIGAAATPGTAHAFYGNGAQIVSADPARQEQGNDGSTFAAVSRDGRYVAFQTRASNFYADDDPDPPGQTRVGGVFRKDLATGAVVRVASGDFLRESDGALVARGAQNPSISADGRFVAFSTDEKLAPGDTNDNVDVYVRDMAKAPGEAGAFSRVSARDGGSDPARYAAPAAGQELPGRNLGADVTPGAAISADGRRVVFETLAASDLPASAKTDTPAFQVWVRDLDARTTRLITAARDTGDPAGGATGPAGISGDGSTVVWTAQNASTQTFFLPGEFPNDQSFFYLWKRIADGPAAPTRRITGRVDVDDPACDRSATINPTTTGTGPCFGPLTVPEGGGASIASTLPAMSDDGRHLAFLTGAGPRPNDTTGAGRDLYLTDMSPGVSRKQGTVELTREGSGDPSASNSIDGVAMSGDGRQVAITSVRTRFVLPALRFVGEARGVSEQRELYVVDVSQRTIELATRALDGSDVDDDIGIVPTISGNGDAIAFASPASNLFFGDGNDRSDAFVINRTAPRSPPAPPAPPPPAPRPQTPPRKPALSVHVRSLGRAVVELTVRTPISGRLEARAVARAPTPRARGRRRPAGRLQVVALARARVLKPGTVRLRLALGARTRRQYRSRRTLVASTTLTLVPVPKAGRLSKRVSVTFRLTSSRR